jgi:hypothetical protein
MSACKRIEHLFVSNQHGDRVKLADPFHERGQDTGIVESIEGEQYVVQWQRDRNLRRYTRKALQTIA